MVTVLCNGKTFGKTVPFSNLAELRICDIQQRSFKADHWKYGLTVDS